MSSHQQESDKNPNKSDENRPSANLQDDGQHSESREQSAPSPSTSHQPDVSDGDKDTSAVEHIDSDIPNPDPHTCIDHSPEDAMLSPDYEYEAMKERAQTTRKHAAKEKAIEKKQHSKKKRAKDNTVNKKWAVETRRDKFVWRRNRALRHRRRPPTSTNKGRQIRAMARYVARSGYARSGATRHGATRRGVTRPPAHARGHARKQKFSLEVIHRTLPTADSLASIIAEKGTTGTNKDEETAFGTNTLKAITSESSNPFEDALHEYSIFTRPEDEKDLEELAEHVTRLVRLCGSSSGRWKLFILVAFRRRYHSRAPAAKAAAAKLLNEEERKSSFAANDGDGERLIFYITCLTLQRLLNIVAASTRSDEFSSVHIEAAVNCMIEVSPTLGGTRDINSLMEHFSFEALLRLRHVSISSPIPDAPSTLREKLLPAVEKMCLQHDSPEDAPLHKILAIAASLLDEDIEKCKQKPGQTSVPREDLMSTIHVTLPHNGRGDKKGKAWQRCLTNCVAELLVWQKSATMKEDDRFARAFNDLRQLSPLSESTMSDAYDKVLKMQTSARKQRKRLNDQARVQGAMLCSSYLMNREAVSFRLVRRAKAGDLAMLKKLASKFEDSKVLRMIMKRGMDPSRAVYAESISALISDWSDINATIEDEESFEALELELQAQVVRATIDRLRPHEGEGEGNIRPVLVVQLGRGRTDCVCAILVAAALGSRCRLLINSEFYDLSGEKGALELLNAAILHELYPPPTGTLKMNTAESVIRDELKESEDLIFVSSSDVQLDEATLQGLHAQDNTIRVHCASKLDLVEPMEIELSNSIYERLKSGSPVSLAVLLDCTGSMGGEIYGCKQGALELIERFNDLAPVQWANFIGYWDPISSPGDPDPTSSRYLNPREKGNLDAIQTFVDSQLPCTGGGDEPEDVPAALEKLIEDMDKVGISSSEGVHFVFFIADAGYREEENQRVERLLEELERRGVVMVTCPVRPSRTCKRFVGETRDIFQPSGQHIGLNGIGQLQSIAATVTESIRASLFKSGNVSGVTSSVGDTIESIGQLCSFQQDHSSIKRVEDLSKAPIEVLPDDEKGDEEESFDQCVGREEDDSEGPKPVFASSGTYTLTSRERLYLQISRLPSVCRRAVENAFGGRSLQETVAAEIAERLLKEEIPILELHRAGYPAELVGLVREMMGGHGMKQSGD